MTDGAITRLDRLERLFHFVRDGVPFGFPPTWDEVRASETLDYGVGYCTTKATLFLALCRAAGIPARVHAGLISLEIMHGIFPAFALRFLPDAGGHMWLEVEVDGAWRPLDSYINDRRFYRGALARLGASGRETGFSLSRAKGPTSCAFNFGEAGFVHMGAVVDDQGAWEDVADYLASPAYRRMRPAERAAYPLLAWMANRAIEGIRRSVPAATEDASLTATVAPPPVA